MGAVPLYSSRMWGPVHVDFVCLLPKARAGLAPRTADLQGYVAHEKPRLVSSRRLVSPRLVSPFGSSQSCLAETGIFLGP